MGIDAWVVNLAELGYRERGASTENTKLAEKERIFSGKLAVSRKTSSGRCRLSGGRKV